MTQPKTITPIEPASASIPCSGGSNWVSHTVAVWEDYLHGEYIAYKPGFYESWRLRHGGKDIFRASTLQEVMEHAHNHAAEQQQ